MNNWSEIYDQWVYKSTVYSSAFYFVSTADLPGLTGFSSLYSVSKEDAQAMATAGSYANFKGTVWSPVLTLDFDSDEAGLEARKRLAGFGLEFWHADTGNRGCHITISRPHKPSHLLPQIDKEWVEKYFPKADMSVYTSLNMFRLEGTIHEKTGIKKVDYERVPGNPLILPDQPSRLQFTNQESYLQDRGSIFTDPLVMTMTIPHQKGERHAMLMKLAVTLRHRGEPVEFISRWLYHTALLFLDKVTPEEQAKLDSMVEFVQGI